MENVVSDFYKFIDLLKQITIDRSDDETMVDFYIADDLIVEDFINNVKYQLDDDDLEVLNTEIKSVTDFESFITSDDARSIIHAICTASYCTWLGVKITDDTRVVDGRHTYYFHWNGLGLDTEHDSDIDLG